MRLVVLKRTCEFSVRANNSLLAGPLDLRVLKKDLTPCARPCNQRPLFRAREQREAATCTSADLSDEEDTLFRTQLAGLAEEPPLKKHAVLAVMKPHTKERPPRKAVSSHRQKIQVTPICCPIFGNENRRNPVSCFPRLKPKSILTLRPTHFRSRSGRPFSVLTCN